LYDGLNSVIEIENIIQNLETARASNLNLYSDGLWFFYNFEQSFKSFSNNSIMFSFTIDINTILKSFQNSVDAMKEFYSSWKWLTNL
jgi:hypothetical protein